MRCLLLALCALTVMASGVAQQNQFLHRYDNFNPDSIIQNERILLAYYKCVMDKGPCTKDGKNFKRVLPETLSTACGRCSPNQKIVVRKMLLGIRAKSEPRFFELLDKYDPTRVNREALYSFLITGDGKSHVGNNTCCCKQLKMKIFILLLCVFAAVIAEENSDLSTENIDLTEVVGNDKLIESYANCLINKGPCTPEMEKIKGLLPEAIATKCSKCTEKQKEVGSQLIKGVREKHPEIWKKLTTYFDPEEKYRESVEEFLKA
ncbi:uncharacterized protein LOC116771972 [Danaus plexippus]|uniref:uncharacterized protein LOC116771972 n=1 Tax=Danaus plexippus TaxID=13037 RepID=UPI002AB298F3|nr:uncharacterized protein LOC116771972 [Danaus plexippus]